MNRQSTMPDVFCLSMHAHYRCRHSGACCSSGWAIPVEAALYRRLGDAAVIARRDLPSGFAGVLRTRADGTCICFDRSTRLCTVHRDMGHDALPHACQQFPRVSLLDRRGVFVTLSHYCPTAAGLLFEDAPIRVIANPPAFPREAAYDGLDAREAYPPLLRPGVLMDWDTLSAWDRFAFDRLDRESDDVDAAIADLRAACDHLRAWTAEDGPLVERLARHVRSAPHTTPQTRQTTVDVDVDVARLWQFDRDVRAAVPAGVAVAPSLELDAFAEIAARGIDPVWRTFVQPLSRYAASKLCGSWCWYQGAGLRTVLRSVEAALAVVRIEAARQIASAGRMLDPHLLHESIRQADLLLLHLASRDALARRWSTAEHAADHHER